MTIDPNAPAPNDYVQLLDGDGDPTDNFTSVAELMSSFDLYDEQGKYTYTVYEIENPAGERYNVVRNSDFDTDMNKGWTEVVEKFYV